MKIVNLKNNKTVAEGVKEPKNFFERIVGLIGASHPYPLMLNTRFGIHTFWVKFPIDVLVIDKNYRVVVKKESLPPGRFFLWNPKFAKVLEFPDGTIKKTDISVGDWLFIK